ncbi:MAG: hypothetical protein EBZ53_05205 [Verrucomicrobia bacterium]|nr:hypothetical protein [Verrucomicrobiota bacterium]
MAEENAPPPAGGEVGTAKKKLRLKVTRVEENKPRVRRRIFTSKPAVEPGGEGSPPVPEEKRVGAGRILQDLGQRAWGAAKGWNRNIWIGIGVTIGMMILLGVWQEWRKTVVRVRVQLNDVRLGDKPEVLVLYDFTERLAGLRRDYGRRLAPLRPQIREIERTLSLAKADAAGTAEKVRMVEQALGEESSKAKQVFEDYKTSVSKLWLEEAGMLDKEFDEKRTTFLGEVEERARALGLFYHPDEDEDLQQPEIAANEFRLALYRAPPSIRLPEQFGWIETKLKNWHEFEKDWNARYKGLGTRAKQLRSPASTSMDLKQERVKIQAQELNKFRGDAQVIQKEIQDYEIRLKELKDREAQAKGPFEEDVNAIPEAFLCVRVPLDADVAPIVVDGKVAQAAPGTLRIVIRGRKEGQPAWVIRTLEPMPHQKTEVIFRDTDFQPLSDWLETD